jgi:tetratricopeptide (TPR) repeat protein
MSVAAIDFENRSGDADKAWLEGELPDTLGSGLVRIPGVRAVPRARIAKMIPRDQSLSEVEIGLRLGCSSVLSGGFEIEDSTISAKIRLTDVATGEVLEDTLSGPLEEIFTLRDQFVAVVAAQLDVEPPRLGDATPKLEAYECYGRARRIGGTAERAAMEQAVELLERAVSLEPGYARALAALANTCAMRYHFTSDPKTLEKAIDYGRRSVAADFSLAEAHLWLGYALYHVGENLESLRELREAMRLDPTSFLPAYFAASPLLFFTSHDELLDLFEEAGGETPDDIHVWRRHEVVEQYQRAAQLNPMFAWAWAGLGGGHLELGHFDEAVTCLKKAVELEPTSIPPIAGVEGYLGECLRRRGDHAAAREHFVAGLEKLEKSDHMYRDTWRGLFLCGLGRNALHLGDQPAAQAAFNQANLHLRGRPARCGGHVLIQALSGMTQAGGGAEPFEEALRLHEGREGFDFTQVWGCTEDVDLLELSRAADTLDRTELAGELFQRALDWGSGEARHELSRQPAERE